jgi:hypothetical protein
MFTEKIELKTHLELAPGQRVRIRGAILEVMRGEHFELNWVEKTLELPHHVVLKNGRFDIVCACGEHFRIQPGLNDQAVRFAGGDAIQQWVTHYKEKTVQPTP